MTGRVWAALAAAGSGALLLGALAFQYIGGLAPCPMCLYQRWPHLAAVIVGAVALAMPRPWLMRIGALGPLTSAAIGIFHTGVERKWWEGPASCTGAGNALSGLSGADLLSTDAPVHLVMCDQVAWSMWGLSMASWNAILSLVLVAVWLIAARASAKPRVLL
ncbi:disulfide bond formation protein B [Falsirhodobacter halotolerans]|uniref:disulfide bond formation protein B n=1 Tax=Falsirhodobacter halotolerans TaxID=1146892 RepID=UPI001FD39EE0|nr:disulfide bond formation protein B [Falsirhodobacter halotolerans]MCJ8139243.1 disulfide bond formation protein B [Falsirhodobacter halotolerans]